MTKKELIAKQQEFIQWLKKRDIYSPYQNSHTMNCMFNVWRIMNEEAGN